VPGWPDVKGFTNAVSAWMRRNCLDVQGRTNAAGAGAQEQHGDFSGQTEKSLASPATEGNQVEDRTK